MASEAIDPQALGTRNKKLQAPRKPLLYGAFSFAKLSVDPSLDPGLIQVLRRNTWSWGLRLSCRLTFEAHRRPELDKAARAAAARSAANATQPQIYTTLCPGPW